MYIIVWLVKLNLSLYLILTLNPISVLILWAMLWLNVLTYYVDTPFVHQTLQFSFDCIIIFVITHDITYFHFPPSSVQNYL